MNTADRKTMIDELERIADRMMAGKATLADPDTLMRMAHDLRTPGEREIHEEHLETDLAAQALRKGRKSKKGHA